MNASTKALLAVIAVFVVIAAVVFSARTRAPAGIAGLADAPGSEALEQMYGSSDVGAGSGQSGVVPSADATPTVGTILGQVVLPSGEPAIGARVSAISPLSDGRYDTEVDAGGLFALQGLPDELFIVEAIRDGYGPAIAVGVATGGAPLRLTLQTGRDVEGLVLLRGEPVPHAVVHVGGPGLFPQRSVVADSRGQFRVSGLREGRYEVAVTAPGLGSGFGGALAIDDTAATSAIRLDLPVYRAATTTIRVSDRVTGEPLPFGVVTLADGPLHVLSLHAPIEVGEAVVDVLPRGEYFLRIRAPGYLPYQGRLFVGNEDEVLDVRLSQGATLSGVVRDPAGNPVPHARMTAVVETPEGGRWELRRSLFDDFHRLVRPDGTPFWLPSIVFATDERGAYQITGIPRGTARIMVEAAGFAPGVSAPIEVDTDQTYPGLDFSLEVERRIRGRVEHEGGGAVEGAVVTVRPPLLPNWVGGEGVTTARNGQFVFSGIGAQVVVRVDHPDFSTTEVELTVPAEGLDDVIVRLRGEQLPSVSGRLFTARGAAAVGAKVWLMSGVSEVPACRATVGADGWFRATHCTAAPDRILASAPGHAPLSAELGGDTEPRDWELPLGGELALVSQRAPVFVSVEPDATLPRAHWPRPELGLDRWSRHIVEHVPAGTYIVTCQAEGFDDAVFEVSVSAGRRTEAACPGMQRLVSTPIYVIDSEGAPVAGALVMIDGVEPPVRELTNERGAIYFETRPGRWLVAEALHEDWGRGSLPFQSPAEAPSEPFRVRLEQGIAGEDVDGFLAQLQTWGIDAVVDGRSVLVDTVRAGTPAAGIGLRRFDKLLWARPVSDFRFTVGVRRGGELLSFEAVREPMTP
jgi:protocatechuate 3,4-dioxygenase beta subunit